MNMAHQRQSSSKGFTLLELLAVVSILAIMAALVCTSASRGSSDSKSAACKIIRGNIEIQVELWRHQTGTWPAINLANIGSDLSYFPSGLPVCPVDGSAYSVNSVGRVIGHNH